MTKFDRQMLLVLMLGLWFLIGLVAIIMVGLSYGVWT